MDRSPACQLCCQCWFLEAAAITESCFGVQRLIESMNKANLDVVVYPTWSNPPRLIGDYFSADGAPCGLKLLRNPGHRLCYYA